VEPVSGGIDSSLGLAICADAVGAENVVAYNMPSSVNSETTKQNAEELADNLGVEYRVLPVEEPYREIIDTYEEHVDEVERTVSRENVYARLRGLFAMLETNEEGSMLVSNGNQTEMALGYATLYGDMTGGLSLLGDVSKTEVYDLAQYVNERHGEEVIPEEVFEQPPSAELSEGQEDPFDYEVVAPVVESFLEQRMDSSSLVEAFDRGELGDGFPDDIDDCYDVDAFEELVEDTYKRFRTAAFKRAQAPPVIAVTGRSFGTDFREPIIDGWQPGGDA
ncbi:MAG: NAD(+) synthase, partial [Candidatus Nanohaloarchaea archaeon]|nr:NAD(+) synthase [Candidatus Nanohaloarchaea archaeon]